MEGLSKLGFTVTWYQCVDHGGHPRIPEGGVEVRGLGFPNRTIDMGANRLWVFRRRLRTLRSEIVLIAEPTLATVAPTDAKLIVYVHDLRPLTHYSDRLVTRLMFRYAIPRLKSAWRILAPTSAVRAELVRIGFDPERVRVVPETHRLGLHPDHVARSVVRRQDQNTTHVLFVGADRRYKNLPFVLRLASLMGRRTQHRYLFTLVTRPRRSTRQLLQRMNLPNVRVLSDVDAVSEIYEESDVLVHPSLYEGFGRPLAEATAFGIPVIANRIPVISEVVGDAGVLLDVTDPTKWADALTSWEDPHVFEVQARKSLARGRDFLPERFQKALAEAILGPSAGPTREEASSDLEASRQRL